MGAVFKRTSTKTLPIGAELYARKGVIRSMENREGKDSDGCRGCPGQRDSHVTGTERLIQRVINELSLRRLTDIRAEAVERRLAQQSTAGMTARACISDLVALRSFCNWSIDWDQLP